MRPGPGPGAAATPPCRQGAAPPRGGRPGGRGGYSRRGRAARRAGRAHLHGGRPGVHRQPGGAHEPRLERDRGRGHHRLEPGVRSRHVLHTQGETRPRPAPLARP